MKEKMKLIGFMLLSAMLVLSGYIFLHECRHTLIAVLCGAKIIHFSFFKAHMRYEGGNFSQLTESLFHAAGMLLPFLVSVVYSYSIKRRENLVFTGFFPFSS